MNVVVIGFGKSGKTAAQLAQSCGYSVTILDEVISESMIAARLEFENMGIQVELGVQSYNLADAMLIIQSPGVPGESSLAQMAASSDIEVISEIEFAAMNTDIPLLAVTGTNGKTTTTELTTHILTSLGYRAKSVGNIGTTLSEVVTSEDKYDYLVVELSSFQLEKSPQLTPLAAVITNISPDHLDRHADLETYTKIKFSVFNNILDCNKKIINEKLFSYWNENISENELPLLFAANAEADFKCADNVILLDEKKIVSLDEVSLNGAHNAENIMASLGLISAALGQDVLFTPKVAKALSSFHVGDHRIEFFHEKDGVQYVDDSKGTNPDAVVAAIRAVGNKKNVCILLGGLDKGMDFSPLLLVSNSIKKAFVIGECRNKIVDVIGKAINTEIFDDFETAVIAAAGCAVKQDVVLLSPACASMDMFKSYRERGERFKQIVCAL